MNVDMLEIVKLNQPCTGIIGTVWLKICVPWSNKKKWEKDGRERNEWKGEEGSGSAHLIEASWSLILARPSRIFVSVSLFNSKLQLFTPVITFVLVAISCTLISTRMVGCCMRERESDAVLMSILQSTSTNFGREIREAESASLHCGKWEEIIAAINSRSLLSNSAGNKEVISVGGRLSRTHWDMRVRAVWCNFFTSFGLVSRVVASCWVYSLVNESELWDVTKNSSMNFFDGALRRAAKLARDMLQKKENKKRKQKKTRKKK